MEGHGEMANVLHQPISVLGLLDLLKIDLNGLPRAVRGEGRQQARFQMDDFGDVQEVVTRNRVAENHGKTTLHLVSKLANPENSKFRQTTVECAG